MPYASVKFCIAPRPPKARSSQPMMLRGRAVVTTSAMAMMHASTARSPTGT
jgi:hypothetical protein